ncbi:glycoside hydrolase [Hypoxylon rubiginosum]|uniref:Glycoside hydrolase n=1 Tax=Hypoxylon rubiginosum TaxID=110542 RepID=A0ACC0CZC9_9PEZI|nr:glycoside hydrolase [Hypoxylon rubiginosum]
MAKSTSLYSSWLTGLLVFLAAIAPLTSAATPTYTTSASRSSGTATPIGGANSKRIVQYCGTLYAPSSLNKVHIADTVNSTRPVYVTDVIYGTWSMQQNKTMTISFNDTNVSPNLPRHAWAWSEMKTVQRAGVSVSMGLRGGFTYFNDNSTFEGYYGALRSTLQKYKFDGIDLDIEDYGEGRPNPITLEAVIRLIQRLRKDFGRDFVITLAPVSTAMAGSGGNMSKFSYTELEKRAGKDISWYNVQFYYLPDELESTDTVDAAMQHGWQPQRIVIGMVTEPDFGQDVWVELPKVAKTLRTVFAKYPALKGVDGFDYYDQKPGGYPAPWEWPAWAAQQISAVGGNGTGSASPSSGARKLVFKA